MHTTSTAVSNDTGQAIAEGDQIAWIQPASEEAVKTILEADEHSQDGRSQWIWVRLANGDLILGVFPQGETYFATENDRQI